MESRTAHLNPFGPSGLRALAGRTRARARAIDGWQHRRARARRAARRTGGAIDHCAGAAVIRSVAADRAAAGTARELDVAARVGTRACDGTRIARRARDDRRVTCIDPVASEVAVEACWARDRAVVAVACAAVDVACHARAARALGRAGATGRNWGGGAGTVRRIDARVGRAAAVGGIGAAPTTTGIISTGREHGHQQGGDAHGPIIQVNDEVAAPIIAAHVTGQVPTVDGQPVLWPSAP